jgi:hypothetical protein
MKRHAPRRNARCELKRWVLLTAVGLLFPTHLCTAQKPGEWPHIQAFDKTFRFASQSDIYLNFRILDVRGNTAYVVECANPFAKEVAKDPRINELDWSGDFECRVGTPGARFLPNVQLLSESIHVTSFWETRARFWWNELTPDCINFPDWGGTRVFRLRHMVLTIQITNPKIVQPSPDSHRSFFHILRGLDVEISGKYDYTAKNSVAGLTNIAEPPPIDLDMPDGPRRCGSAPK